MYVHEAGYEADRNIIILAFAGTDPSSLANWVDDLKYTFTAYPPCASTGCLVHQGFYDTYVSIQMQVFEAVHAMQVAFPTASVLVTGHSLGAHRASLSLFCPIRTWMIAIIQMCISPLDDLRLLLLCDPGAALALFAQLELTVAGVPMVPDRMFSFGQPRVGNAAFVAYAHTQMGPQYRLTHWRDPIPHICLESLGFLSLPNEIFYTEDEASWINCHDNITAEDDSCSNQFYLYLSYSDHLHYARYNLLDAC
jgi:predicted lipase